MKHILVFWWEETDFHFTTVVGTLSGQTQRAHNPRCPQGHWKIWVVRMWSRGLIASPLKDFFRLGALEKWEAGQRHSNLLGELSRKLSSSILINLDWTCQTVYICVDYPKLVPSILYKSLNQLFSSLSVTWIFVYIVGSDSWPRSQFLIQQVWVGPRICISNKLPGDAVAAGPRITLWEPLVQLFPFSHSLFSLQAVKEL